LCHSVGPQLIDLKFKDEQDDSQPALFKGMVVTCRLLCTAFWLCDMEQA
jgi:hypothetical protein